MTNTSTSTTTSTAAASRSSRYRWRVVDIVVASVVAVACGVVFVVWNIASGPLTAPLTALLPGLGALGSGPWLFAGVLVGLIIRKPGAALFGELLAAIVSALVGNQWGITVIYSGVVQGLGAELIFAVFLYANWRWYVAVFAGMGAAVGMAALDLTTWYAGADVPFAVIYTISGLISGAVIAGFLSWLAVRGLAKTGALNRFASGRDGGVRV